MIFHVRISTLNVECSGDNVGWLTGSKLKGQLANLEFTRKPTIRDVTEPAKIRIRWMCGFHVQNTSDANLLRNET